MYDINGCRSFKTAIFVTAAAVDAINSKHFSHSYHENTSIAVSVDAPQFHRRSGLYQCNIKYYTTVMASDSWYREQRPFH